MFRGVIYNELHRESDLAGFRGHVRRACKVKVEAQRPDGSHFEVLAEGHAAGTMQHENDHLHATLFPDITVSPSEGGLGLMTSAAFDEFHKERFFERAMCMNVDYPKALQIINL